MRFYRAHIQECRYSHCKYFAVNEDKTAMEVIEKHYPYKNKILLVEEVSKETVKNDSRSILF